MKTLLIMLLCAGWVGAGEKEELIHEIKQDDSIITLYQWVKTQCDHEWEASEYRLVIITTTTYGTNFEHPKVEVCSKCGILRIDPKSLEKK